MTTDKLGNTSSVSQFALRYSDLDARCHIAALATPPRAAGSALGTSAKFVALFKSPLGMHGFTQQHHYQDEIISFLARIGIIT